MWVKRFLRDAASLPESGPNLAEFKLEKFVEAALTAQCRRLIPKQAEVIKTSRLTLSGIRLDVVGCPSPAVADH